MTDEREPMWRRRRRVRGSLVMSVSFQPEQRMQLDALSRSYGLSRQDVVRVLIDIAASHLTDEEGQPQAS